jgi:hypothetical protein
MPDLETLFRRPTASWGLRGDPHLWKALRARLRPEQGWPSAAAFDASLGAAFEALLAEGLTHSRGDTVWFEQFPQAGMSGGMVSLRWWRTTGLPLLKQRYRAEALQEP